MRNADALTFAVEVGGPFTSRDLSERFGDTMTGTAGCLRLLADNRHLARTRIQYGYAYVVTKRGMKRLEYLRTMGLA